MEQQANKDKPPTQPRSKKIAALWELSFGQRSRFAAALAALLVGTVLLYLPPQIVRLSIDAVLDKTSVQSSWMTRLLNTVDAWNHPQRALIFAGLAVVAITIFGSCFTYFRGRWTTFAAESIARSLRMRLYDHLQHVPIPWHDKAQTGDIVQRCTSDVDTVRMLFSSQAVEIARALVLLGIGLPLMFWMDTKLAMVAIAVLPVIVIFALIFFGRVRGSFKKMDEAEGAMTATLQENLTGIRVVRAFARQQYEIERFALKKSNPPRAEREDVSHHGAVLVQLGHAQLPARRLGAVRRRVSRLHRTHHAGHARGIPFVHAALPMAGAADGTSANRTGQGDRVDGPNPGDSGNAARSGSNAGGNARAVPAR